VDVTQNGIAQKLKQGQPGRQQSKKESLVRQPLPAIHRVLPKILKGLYGLISVHLRAIPAFRLPKRGG
jgi:hypothetical protein